jgi:hypothetical protein
MMYSFQVLFLVENKSRLEAVRAVVKYGTFHIHGVERQVSAFVNNCRTQYIHE